jgi:hypothetical protein
MNKVVQFFIVGALVIAAIALFDTERKISHKVLANVRSGEPERIVVAAILTIALGMFAVIAAQLFRKAT